LIFSQGRKDANNKNTNNHIGNIPIKDKFKWQPGAVLSIVAKNDSTWIIKINLLTQNPKWLPGVAGTGNFFINLHKILNLTISNKTKTYKCEDSCKPETSSKTSDFIDEIQKIIAEYKDEPEILENEPYVYTVYFDFDENTITALHEKCLP
jgi:hypothetical protein